MTSAEQPELILNAERKLREDRDRMDADSARLDAIHQATNHVAELAAMVLQQQMGMLFALAFNPNLGKKKLP